MKKIFIFLTLVSFIYNSYAQAYNLSMGINFSYQDRSIEIGYKQKPLMGFNAQFSRDFRLWKALNIRSELGFFQAGVRYNQPRYMEFLSYSQFGLFLMYKSVRSPFYVGIGGVGDLLLSASAFDGETTIKLNKAIFDFYDYAIEPIWGMSLDFDFIAYFLEMRFHYGLNNISIDNSEKIKNFGFKISLGVSLKIH